jgi:lysozyme family protein
LTSPALTLEEAKAIYRRDYWAPAGCDVVPEGIRFDLFDTAVNSGVVAAIRMLQRASNETDDGKLGSRTLLAAQTMDPERLLARFNGHRLDYLNDQKTWPAFGKGWTQRIAQNLMEA